MAGLVRERERERVGEDDDEGTWGETLTLTSSHWQQKYTGGVASFYLSNIYTSLSYSNRVTSLHGRTPNNP